MKWILEKHNPGSDNEAYFMLTFPPDPLPCFAVTLIFYVDDLRH